MKTTPLLLACLLITNILFAQHAGDLDAAFNGGKVTVDRAPLDVLISVVVLPDGKILAGGITGDVKDLSKNSNNFILARFNPNGSLDQAFGTGGIVNTGVLFDALSNHPFALQDDGKIVVAGIEKHEEDYDNVSAHPLDNIYIVRYNANGTIDNAFNKVVVSDSGSIENAFIMIQSDGDIAIVGNRMSPTSLEPESEIFMVLCDREGKIENRNKVSGGFAELTSVTMQPDDKVLVLCKAYHGRAFGLLRLNADCSLDNTFADNGVAGDSLDIDKTPMLVSAVGLQSDGKIVITGTIGFYGWYGDDVKAQFGLVRYNNDGTLDASFGDNGRQTTTLDTISMAQALLIQPDDKIVVAGLSGPSDESIDFALVRYNADGSVDHDFGKSGIVTTRFGASAVIFGLAQQQDGKIIAAGGTSDGGIHEVIENVDLALARYHGEPGNKLVETAPVAANLSITSPVKSEELLQYTLEQDGNITIELYDINGRLVMTLASNEPRSAGAHSETLHFDESLPSGRYLLTLSTMKGSTSSWVVKQ